MLSIYLSILLIFAGLNSFAEARFVNEKTAINNEIVTNYLNADQVPFTYHYYEYLGECPEGYEGFVFLWIFYDEFDNIIDSGGNEEGCTPARQPQEPQP